MQRSLATLVVFALVVAPSSALGVDNLRGKTRSGSTRVRIESDLTRAASVDPPCTAYSKNILDTSRVKRGDMKEGNYKIICMGQPGKCKGLGKELCEILAAEAAPLNCTSGGADCHSKNSTAPGPDQAQASDSANVVATVAQIRASGAGSSSSSARYSGLHSVVKFLSEWPLRENQDMEVQEKALTEKNNSLEVLRRESDQAIALLNTEMSNVKREAGTLATNEEKLAKELDEADGKTDTAQVAKRKANFDARLAGIETHYKMLGEAADADIKAVHFAKIFSDLNAKAAMVREEITGAQNFISKAEEQLNTLRATTEQRAAKAQQVLASSKGILSGLKRGHGASAEQLATIGAEVEKCENERKEALNVAVTKVRSHLVKKLNKQNTQYKKERLVAEENIKAAKEVIESKTDDDNQTLVAEIAALVASDAATTTELNTRASEMKTTLVEKGLDLTQDARSMFDTIESAIPGAGDEVMAAAEDHIAEVQSQLVEGDKVKQQAAMAQIELNGALQVEKEDENVLKALEKTLNPDAISVSINDASISDASTDLSNSLAKGHLDGRHLDGADQGSTISMQAANEGRKLEAAEAKRADELTKGKIADAKANLQKDKDNVQKSAADLANVAAGNVPGVGNRSLADINAEKFQTAEEWYSSKMPTPTGNPSTALDYVQQTSKGMVEFETTLKTLTASAASNLDALRESAETAKSDITGSIESVKATVERLKTEMAAHKAGAKKNREALEGLADEDTRLMRDAAVREAAQKARLDKALENMEAVQGQAAAAEKTARDVLQQLDAQLVETNGHVAKFRTEADELKQLHDEQMKALLRDTANIQASTRRLGELNKQLEQSLTEAGPVLDSCKAAQGEEGGLAKKLTKDMNRAAAKDDALYKKQREDLKSLSASLNAKVHDITHDRKTRGDEDVDCITFGDECGIFKDGKVVDEDGKVFDEDDDVCDGDTQKCRLKGDSEGDVAEGDLVEGDVVLCAC